MAIRKILCLLDGGEGSEAVLRTALALGETQEAYVEALHVSIDPQHAVPLAADGMTATMIEDIIETVRQESEKRAEAAAEVYARRVSNAGLPTIEAGSEVPEGFAVAYRTLQGREHEVVAGRGMLFDLLVVTRQHGEGEPPATPTLESAIMETGRPVLVAPTTPPEAIGSHVAFAWRATVPGVHALAAALPIMKAAKKVTVITVDEGGVGADPGDVVGYLAYHGIRAEAKPVRGGGREAGQAILEEATAAGADMLAMGAYAHSRLRQLILGGVTRTVLRSASLPLMLAH